MEEQATLKIENHSVSGKDYRGNGIHVYVPGSAFGDKALVVDIPARAVNGLIKYLKTAPAVKITTIKEGVARASEPEEPKETGEGCLEENIGSEPEQPVVPTSEPEITGEGEQDTEVKTPQVKKSKKRRGGKAK